MKNIVLASLLALAGGILGATPLDVLVSGGSLTDGGITVSGFSFTRTCSGGPGVCAPADAAGIEVTLVGGHLQFAGGFSALSSNGFQSADFLIGYDYNGLSADRVGLTFNGAVVGNQSFAQVVETILVAGPYIAGQGQVDAPGGPLSTIIQLAGWYDSFRVVKDILLVGSSSNGLGYATISYVDQFYPDTATPEPGTAVIGLGLIGLYLYKRR